MVGAPSELRPCLHFHLRPGKRGVNDSLAPVTFWITGLRCPAPAPPPPGWPGVAAPSQAPPWLPGGSLASPASLAPPASPAPPAPPAYPAPLAPPASLASPASPAPLAPPGSLATPASPAPPVPLASLAHAGASPQPLPSPWETGPCRGRPERPECPGASTDFGARDMDSDSDSPLNYSWPSFPKMKTRRRAAKPGRPRSLPSGPRGLALLPLVLPPFRRLPDEVQVPACFCAAPRSDSDSA